MTRSVWIVMGLSVAMALLPVCAKAAPAGPTTSNQKSFEDDALGQTGVDGSAGGAKTALPSAGSTGFDAMHVALALAGVLGLILVLRAGAKRIFPAAVSHRNSGVVKVLSRCTISPRQHLLLIRVGKRLLVVGDSGSQLNPLCEITDEEEVAAILGGIREETVSAAGRFDLFFGRARKGFGDGEPAEDTAGERFDATHEVNDPSLTATEKELAGLSDKVRNLARQLGKA